MRFPDFLPADHPHLFLRLFQNAVSQHDEFRTVEFSGINFSVMFHPHDGKSGISDSSDAADRKRLGNSFHTFIDIGVAAHERRDDFTRKSSQDIGFYAATHTVCQYENRLVRFSYDIDHISAQFLALFPQALAVGFYIIVIHHTTRPHPSRAWI